MSMRVSVLDDYLDTVRHLQCFEKLHEHEVTVFNDHVEVSVVNPEVLPWAQGAVG
jgi:hypothetical protein